MEPVNANGAEVKFYDVVTHDKEGNEIVTVFFGLRKASTACSRAEPFVFDGPATEAHKREYAEAYAIYEDEKTRPEVPAMIEAPIVEVEQPKLDVAAAEAAAAEPVGNEDPAYIEG